LSVQPLFRRNPYCVSENFLATGICGRACTSAIS
jgi:hypothetical protein